MFQTKPKILLIIPIMFLYACSNQEATTPKEDFHQFTLLDSKHTGITFKNELIEDVHDESRNLHSFDYLFNGSGVAVADFNNDGFQDIVFASNDGENQIYINEGELKFEDVTQKAGINQGKTWTTGVTTVDINQDGWMDIYFCQSGAFNKDWSEKKNLLFINNGDLTFSEKAKEYGLDNSNMSTQASFFDMDQDGDLDCFVLNESKYPGVPYNQVKEELKSKSNLRRASSTMYRNDNGIYTDITEDAGMLKWGFGLGLLTTDINNDGLIDVYVANDYSVPDFLYINQGDGTFKDEVKQFTNQISFYSMGIDIADINNDGYKDIAVLDMASDDHFRSKTLMPSMSNEAFWHYIYQRNYHYQYMFNCFQLNNGNHTFSNISHMSGVSQTDWSWASLLADFDNDGFKDYYVTNGYKRYGRDNDLRNLMKKARNENGGSIPIEERQKYYDMMPSIKLPNKMYHNQGDLTFKAVEGEWAIDQESFSNGALYSDLDNDGDLDIVVNNLTMDAFVYRNNQDQAQENNYLTIDLKADFPTENTMITLHYNGNKQIQESIGTRGYLSTVDRRVHFGLGSTTKIDSIEVHWSNQPNVQILKEVASNQVLSIRYDKNQLNKVSSEKKNPLIKEIQPQNLGIEFVHRENIFDDFTAQVLLPQKQSNLGPALAVGDVNNDGLEDFFIGGAAGQSGILYQQTMEGKFFYDNTDQPWALEKESEDIAAHFYDADGDGDLDLYIASGGSEFEEGNQNLLDRLYINVKDGVFRRVKAGLPNVMNYGSCIAATDYDKDGDQDVFVGGKSIGGKYPNASPSSLYNFNNFKYQDQLQELNQSKDVGMITDVAWFDYDGDRWQDLLVVGEWMSPRLFKNVNGKFEEKTTSLGLDQEKGWWQSAAVTDIDGDGDLDFVAGNLGKNNKFKASKEKPFKVFANDFDQNGTCDIILSKKYKGKDVPTRGRQCSSEQMPFIEDKFKTYKDFANASIVDIIGKDGQKDAIKLEVTDFASKVFYNHGADGFKSEDLPAIVQKAPINAIVFEDINADGKTDIIVTGNLFETEVETPRYDAGTGQVLLNRDGSFEALLPNESGFFTFKNAKNMEQIRIANKKHLIVANNNDKIQFFEVKQ